MKRLSCRQDSTLTRRTGPHDAGAVSQFSDVREAVGPLWACTETLVITADQRRRSGSALRFATHVHCRSHEGHPCELCNKGVQP